MTEDEMNRFIASLSLATPEPEFNVRNLPSAPSYRSLQPDTGMFVGGGGERDVSGDYRNVAIQPGFRAGPVSGSATVATGRDMPTPGVGYSVNTELPGGFNAGYRRMHAMEAPSRYDQHMLSLAREVLGGNVSGSMTEQDGRRGFGVGASHPLGGGGNAFINAQRDPRGGHAIMGGMDMRFSRGGYAGGGDPEIQSNGMPVISDGQINWGDSSSAADFARADQAMQAMQAMRSAPAPEPQAAPRIEPRRATPAYSAPRDVPRDVPLPPVRPANLGQPVFQNSNPEGPGAYNPDDGFPARPPGQYADPAMLFDPNMMAKGFTPPLEAPSAPPPASPPPPPPPGASDWRRGSFPQEGGGKYTNRAMPLTPPAQAEPLALMPTPTKAVASAAIEQAAPAQAAPTRALPAMTPQQRDLIIRTIAAESSGKTPEEGQGIANVILNRIASGRYGRTPEKVLFAPKQFEPWADPRGSNYPMRHKPGTTKYEKAQDALEAAMGGDDITNGATLFWGPKSQAALGRPAPKWGRTGGLDIGETRFHRDDGGMVEEREAHAGGKAVGAALLGGRKHLPLVTPPARAPRAFELDYPRGAEANAAGRLERSIDGVPLTAPHIAGRQTPGGPDVPLSKQDMEAIMAHITGRPVEYGPLSGGLADAVTVNKGSGRPTGVTIADNLSEAQQNLVVPHAFGHVVDDRAGMIPLTGIRGQAEKAYNTLATGQERERHLTTPRTQGYPREDVPRELSAEMIRAYATDPNYLKTVAPDVAKRIRDYVNTNPELSKIVQFNAVPAAIGAGAMMQGDGEAPVEREAHGGGSRVIGNAANAVVEAALEALRGGRKIFPKPQRMFPEGARPPGGEFIDAATGEAVTGQKPARAVIGVTPEGKPVFLTDQQQVDVTGSPGKGSSKTMTNLFRKSAGWEWQNAPEGYENIPMIVSTKNRGQHYYSLGADYPKGVDLARYPKETSEPRLKPTTQGNVYPGDEVGTILNKKTGDAHPVYDMVTIRNLLAGTGAAGAGAAAMPDEGAAEPIEREPHAGGKAVGKVGGELIDKGIKAVSGLFKPAATELTGEALAAAEAAAAAKAAAVAKQLGRVEQHVDAPSQRINDWQWRPTTDVAKDLDLQEIPPHVQAFGDYMRDMVAKANKEGLSDRDLIKAYTTTRASIQRRAADTDKIREASGLPLIGAESKIRPEGAWSEWLMSPDGQKYLDKAVKGEMSGDAVESALSVMRGFGLAPTQIKAMDWAARNLPGRSQAASDLVYRAGQQASPVSEWRNFTSDVKGVGPAKSGFLASLLGRGDLPTLDARQVLINTGMPTDASKSIMGRTFQGQKSFGAQEGVDRLSGRQAALGLEAPSKYDPFYQHLTHHSIWDKASNEMTTHADIINAMRNAAIAVGVPAAGAATMPRGEQQGEQQDEQFAHGGIVERALHLARGGYATPGFVNEQPEEEYPDGARPLTIYRGERPDAAAGPVETRGPTSHARYQATLGQLGRSDDVPPMDPAVMGQNWANAVRNFKVPDYATYEPNEPRRDPAREQFASPRAKSGREWIYDTIVGSPENSTIQNNRANIAGLLAGSGGTGVGALDFAPGIGQYLNASDIAQSLGEGDYVGAGVSGAMMAAAPFAGKLIKPAQNLGRKAVNLAKSVSDDTLNYLVPRAMGAAGAAGVLAPGDAEAANLSKLKGFFPKHVPTGTVTTRTGADILAKDPYLAANIPQLSSVKNSMPFNEMSVGYETIPGYNSRYNPIKFDTLEGSWAVPLLSDLSSSGVIVHEIGGNKLTKPFYTEGGGDFARGPAGRGSDPAGWASMHDKAGTYMNSLERRIPEGDRVFGFQATMAPTAADSSDMFYQAMLRQIPGAKITKAGIADVDEKMRKLFPGWPGIMNTDEAERFMQPMDLVERKNLAKTLDKVTPQKAGFPDVGQTRFAITEPRLFGNSGLRAGYSVSELDPRGGVLAKPSYPHSNYTGSMAAPKSGGYIGGLESSVHASDIWNDWWNKLNPAAHDPKQWAKAQWGMLTQFPAEKIDAKMVDRVMKKQEEHKRIFGWSSGGEINQE
tara:strand:+ start:126 stop:6242 length:6117 start_codon:yes stop_codon:yes gene_type:complete